MDNLPPKRYRLTVDVTPAQHQFLKNLSHGWKKQIFSALIDMLIDMTRRCGVRSLAIIAGSHLKMEDYFQEEEKDGYQFPS